MQELPRDRVALELDGRPWRVVPTNAVARAGLRVGLELDRERVRTFRRELRRAEALDVAGRALSRRDAARAELALRLERRGVDAALRGETLDRLEELGLVDDTRFAEARATHLAGKGYGNAAILADLETRGVGDELARGACAALENEATRARLLVERLGRSAKTASYLARRGFEEDVVLAAAGGDSELYES